MCQKAPLDGLVFIQGPFFKLECSFFGGFLIHILLLFSDRNARLQFEFADSTHVLLLYRHRQPYDIAPIQTHRKPGSVFTFTLIPTTLDAPRLGGSYCNWRLFHDMFAFTLDRPETATLDPMPDTDQALLHTIFAAPHKDERIWAVRTRYQKYDRLFFSTTGKKLHCLLCGRHFTSPLALAKSCLGFPLLLSKDDLETALPVTIHFEDGVIRAKAVPDMGNFASLFYAISNDGDQKTAPQQNAPQQNAPQQNATIKTPALVPFLSAIYELEMPPTCPLSVVKLANQLLNSNGIRIPIFILYDIKLDDNQIMAVQAKIWLSRPISENLPSGLSLHTPLDKFHSLLFQGLYRSIVKETRAIPSTFGSIHYWRDGYQLGLASKTTAQTYANTKQ
jgi:hypothetical protein